MKYIRIEHTFLFILKWNNI